MAKKETKSLFKLSIIIPTRNRANMLHDTLQSLRVGCAGQEKNIECLIIDNGSTDDTKSVVDCYMSIASFKVHYVYDACPGLHVGRNLGAHLANGEILAYLDDDVYVDAGWVEAVIARFETDDTIALVGGPCRPAWEDTVPSWVEAFKIEHCDGWYYAGFSLIDLGDVPRPVPFDCVFGCNFCIRKDVLLQAGGFHPDGMPLSLLHFRGDGEDAVAKYIEKSGLIIYYEPRASIWHRVPSTRLTKEYILGVGRRSGISIGYTQYRTLRQLGVMALIRQAMLHAKFWMLSCFKYLRFFITTQIDDEQIYALCMLTAHRAMAVHFFRILFSPTLARWVMQTTYFKADPCPYWQGR